MQDGSAPAAPDGTRCTAAEVEFADVDGTGVRSNALEFARASRMVRPTTSASCPSHTLCVISQSCTVERRPQ